MAAINQNPLQHPTLHADIAQVNTCIAKMTDQSLSGKASLIKEFSKENPKVIIRIAGDIAGKAAFGAALGAAAAGGFALWVAPPSAPSAANWGMLAGGAIGGYFGIKDQVLYIQSSRVFENWKTKAIKDQVYPLFQKYVSENLTADFKCVYTSDFIMHPLRDTHGHVFEQHDIMADLRSKNGKMQCPITRHNLEATDLSYDLNYHRTLLQALRPAFDTAVQDPNVVAGALALRQNIEEERTQMVRESTDHLMKQYMDCKSPEDEESTAQLIMAALKENKKKFQLVG